MKKLQTEFLYLDNAKETAFVKLSGEVDLSNSNEFSSFIEKIFIQPWNKLVFDLEKLVYMNSSGFGVLAGAILREQDQKNRPVVLCKMNELLHPIFQILGFENICPIYDTVDQALQAPKNTKIQEAIEEIHSSPKPQPKKEVVFPITRACTQCNRSSNFNKVGHYRCPFCRAIHLVDKYGTLQLISKGSVPTPIEKRKDDFSTDNIVHQNDENTIPCDERIEFSLPSDMKYLAQIRDFIFSFVENKFYKQDRNNMVVSLDEACANAIEHAHGFNRAKRIYITLDIFPDKFTMTVRDSGVNTYRADLPNLTLQKEVVKEKGRGMGLILIKRMMDEIVFAPTATNGTSIRMTKYYTKDSEQVSENNTKNETKDITSNTPEQETNNNDVVFNTNESEANNNDIISNTPEQETNNNDVVSNTNGSETNNNDIISNTSEQETNDTIFNTTEPMANSNDIEDINNNVNTELNNLDNQPDVMENLEEFVNLPTIENQTDVLTEF